MKAKKQYITTALLLIALVGTASAAEFYVDPINGSISGDGSSLDPWGTIQEVFENGLIGTTVQAGDTVYLRTGYHGEIIYSNANNSDYITIEAEAGHTPKLKRIKLKSSSKWIFRGLTLSLEFAPVYEKPDYGIIEVWNSQDMIIEDNNIFSVQDASSWTENNWNSLASRGIFSYNSPNVIIRNNTIKNVAYGIGILWGHGSLIEYNKVEHNIGDGIQAVSTSDVVVQYNTLKNFYTVGGTHMDGIQFYGPVIGEPPCNDVTLRGNLIIHQEPHITKFPGDMHGIGCFDGPYNNWLVENNVVIIKHLHGIAIYGATDSKIINNIAYHPTPTYPSGVRIHTGLWRALILF